MSQTTPVGTHVNSPSANRILIVSGFGMLFDAFDVGLLSYVLISIAKLWHINPTVTGLIGSVSLVGMAIGSALAGSLADRFGRRSLFMVTLLIYSLATGLSALATGVIMFFILRFLVGLGLGGELPVATTYVLESSDSNRRGRRVVYLETFWALGSLVAALVSFFVIPSLGWRIVSSSAPYRPSTRLFFEHHCRKRVRLPCKPSNPPYALHGNRSFPQATAVERLSLPFFGL